MSAPRRPPIPLRECVVVVTPRSFGLHDPGLRERLEAAVGEVRYHPGPLPADRLAPLLADADGLLAGLDEITARVLEGATRLRVIARYGVGADRIDLAAAAARGVVVTVTPGANANAVAELAIAFVFALARPIVQGRAAAREGRWPAMPGMEVAGRTLGVVGLGRIGSLVAHKARALGMRVLAHDPLVRESEDAEVVALAALLPECDFVSLHATLTSETRGLVRRDLLERLKPGAVLINTARGELIDEQDLISALDAGHLRAAALDVLAEEPPRPDHPLLARDDVLITPHMGPHTAESMNAMGRIASEDLITVLSGGAPRYPL